MFESRVVRYLLGGAGVLVTAEILYALNMWYYRKIQKVHDKIKEDKEVAEVLWTNEKSASCGHVDELQRRNVNADGPDNISRPACHNPVCAVKNIKRLVDLIDGAQISVDLAMYTFTSHDLATAFMRAEERGVVVRIITDKEMSGSSGSQVNVLNMRGVEIRFPISGMIMHHKFCIIDGPARYDFIINELELKCPKNTEDIIPILMTGSQNWTLQGFGGNWENLLITSNKKIIGEFETEFNRMWQAFPYKRPVLTRKR